MNIKSKKKLPGFTLIEILLVVALIAILAAITFIAINPVSAFQNTRNAQRSSDVSEILNAITQYTAVNGNSLTTITAGTIPICPTFTHLGTGASNIDLTTALVDTYIAGIPQDPSGGTAADTGYQMCKTATGRVTVSAPNAENGKTISVKR